MESSQPAGLVKPSEWILLMFATVLLTAAVTHQRASTGNAPVEAKVDLPVNETSPGDKSADVASETEIVAVVARQLAEPADLPN